jgi:hypothetical protein
MTIKSALSVVALAAGLVAVPALAQAPKMIGSQTVAEADVEAVKARCLDLQTAAETQSLTTESDSETETEEEAATDNETSVAGDAAIANEPALTESPTALSVDLAVVTLEDCEAGGWFEQ